MKKIFFIIPLLSLASCDHGSQQDSDPKVCERLQSEIVQTQKATARSAMGWISDGNVIEERNREIARTGNNHYQRFELEMVRLEGRDNIHMRLVLMASKGCDLPDTVPRWTDYAQAATACTEARNANSSEAERLCDISIWQPDEKSGG